ncbi:MAG: DUF4169 family protein [Rhodobacteraceae bacterium]|nr:DUF4169 family protein [Paracoccaceae bacterium]
MAEIINLNRARKTKTRAEKRKIADQNAQKFGRTKGIPSLARTVKCATGTGRP